MIEQELIEGCKKKDRKIQKLFYDRYSPKMFGVCKRYVKNREDAEDVLVEGLYKALKNIHQFQDKGSFEGWVRRIVVNEALMFLRKQHKHFITDDLDKAVNASPVQVTIEGELAAQDILKLLDQLPDGYRTIFNLYVVEGYKHREIAEMLGISINTSKSQLILAKKKLQGLVRQQQNLPDF